MKTIDRVKQHFKADRVEFLFYGSYMAIKVLPKIDRKDAIEKNFFDVLVLDSIDTSKWSDYYYDWIKDIEIAVNSQIMKTGKRPEVVIFTFNEFSNMCKSQKVLDICYSAGDNDMKKAMVNILSDFGIKNMIVLDVEYKS